MNTNNNTTTFVRLSCKDCQYATLDMKEENLSIEGHPTLVSCALKPWPKHIISELACENFKPRS